MNLNRPSAPLSTVLGIALIAGAMAAGIVIIAWHSPTAATLTAMLAGGATAIGVLERAPLPSPEPTPVQTHGADVIATKEQT